MRFKILLLISPLLIVTTSLLARPVFDSVGVENQNGKKVILHKVEPKETYYAVGRRYDVKPNLIIQFNNNQILQPGAVIKVPTERPFDETAAAKAAQQAVAAKKAEKTSVQQYKVSAHETLYSIAKRFNTTVDDIKQDNDLKSDALASGQILIIKTTGNTTTSSEKEVRETVAETKPATQTTPPVVQQKPQVQPPVTTPPVTQQKPQVQTPVTTPPPVNNTTQQTPSAPVSTVNTQQYKVSNGETLYTIAKRFGTSVDDIIALNKLSNNTITPGQLITVRSGMPPAPKPQASTPAAPAQQQETVLAKRDTTSVAAAVDSADRHVPGNRYGLFVKEEKGPATWMDDPGFDPNKKMVLHRTAPIGTVIKITNPVTNRTTFAKVVGRFTDNEANKDVIVVVTKNVAESLGVLDKRFRVNISYGVANNEQ